MFQETPSSLWAAIEESAGRNPDSIAIVSQEGTQISFRELSERIRQFSLPSHHESSGVMALQIPDPLEQLTGMLAALRANRAYWVVPDSLNHSEVDSYLSNLQPNAQASVAYLTSGSSGKSKLLRRTARQILTRYELYSEECSFSSGDRFCLMGHPGFVAAESEIFGALLSGASLHLVLPNSLSPREFTQWIQREKISILHPPVPFFEAWKQCWGETEHFPSLRCLLLGGGRLSTHSVQDLLKHFSDEALVHHRYSSTETGPIARTILLFDDDLPDATSVPLGSPYPFVEWKQSDQYEGELLIRSPELSPDASVDADGYFRTNDWISVSSDGIWQFEGRQDGIHKIKGFRVHTQKVEDALRSLPVVSEACVLVVEERDRSRLIGFVSGNGQVLLSAAHIQSQLEEKLTLWERPNQVIIIDSIPKTSTGKIDRVQLRNFVSEASPAALNFDRVSDQLKALWISCSKWIGEIDPETDLLSQGGDSITVISFLNAIQQTMAIEISQSDFVQHSSISALGDFLSTKTTGLSAGSDSPKLLNRPGFPPLVCLPVSGDPTLRYWELARALDGILSVYVLMPKGLTGDARPLHSIDEQVEYYSRQVAKHFGDQPIHLCGLSIAGITAHAIACGNSLSLTSLILLDSQLNRFKRKHSRNTTKQSDVARIIDFLRRNRKDLKTAIHKHRYQIRNEIRFGTLAKVHQVRDLVRHQIGFRIKNRWILLLAQGWWKFYVDSAARTFPIAWRDAYFLHQNLKARRSYDPKPYPGTSLLITTNGFHNEGPEMRSAPWKILCSGLNTAHVETDHTRVCAVPYVRETANLISDFTKQ